MAFDVTNTLETATTNNGDIDWYDGSGTIQGTLVSHSGTTGGFWYVNSTSTPSSSTGPDATGNPPGNDSFTYAEMSGSPSGYEYRGVWTTQYSNLTQNLFVEIDYYLYALSGSELFVEYATAASPTPNTNTDWTVADSVVATGSDPGAWNTLSVDLSGIASSSTVSIRVRYLSVSNNYANDGAIANFRIYGVDTEGISSVTPSEFDMDTVSIDVDGSNFGASIGSGALYLSDADTLAGSANEVDVTAALNTWSDTQINLDLTQLSASELADLHTLGPGQRYVIVVTNVPDEYGSPAVTLHRPQGFQVVASSNVTNGAASAGTLTAPSGKSVGADFGGGRTMDTANTAAPTDDLATDEYREDLWNLQATTSAREAQYQFRVVVDGTALDTYSVDPRLTVTAGGSGATVTPTAIAATATVPTPTVTVPVTFPVLEEVTIRSFTSAATTHNAALPATVNVGDRILAWVVGWNSGYTITTPTGWALLSGPEGTGGSEGATGNLYWLDGDAVGDEDGTNVNFVSSTANEMLVWFFRFQAGTFDSATDPAGTVTGTTSGNPDPPNLAPGWGALDIAWWAGWGSWDMEGMSGIPSGFTAEPTSGLGYQETGTGGDNVSGSVAWSEQTVASLNPSNFTTDFTTDTVHFTFAIKPPASGDATVTPTAIAATATIPTSTVSGSASVSDMAIAAISTVNTVTVTSSVDVTASAAGATTTLPPPTVTGTANITGIAQASTGTVPTPTVTTATSVEVTPTVITASGTVDTPTVTSAVEVAATVLAATATVDTPAMSVGVTVTGTALAPAATVPAPTVTTGASVNISATAVAAVGTVDPPAVSVGVTIPASGLAATGTPDTPTVATGSTVTATGITAVGTVDTPTAAGNVDIQATAPAVSGTVDTPTVSGSAEATTTTSAATGTVPTPSVSTSGNVNIAANALTATGTVDTPAISVGATVTATAQAGTATVDTPTVTTAASVNISATAIAATANFGTVTVTGAVLAVVALDYGQFQRLNGNLFLSPVGRSVRSGFKTSEGWDRASDVFRYDQLATSAATAEKAQTAVAAAWAANSAADAATLKAAINQALEDAGFRGPGGANLT